MNDPAERAQYLLRIDDLCPTVHGERWQRVSATIRRHGIRPILAVVPDNRDPELAISAADAGFWAAMRSMEQEGAVVALHGFQHVCARRARSMVPLHGTGEFAGAPLEVQRRWIREGLGILRGHGLEPKLWVAPRHSFDRNTLEALRGEGIGFLSDGQARRPHLREDVVWIPQQLWSPVEKTKGLWTICFHPNGLDETQLRAVEAFLAEHAAQFTSFERVAREWSARRLGWMEAAREQGEILLLLSRRKMRFLRARNAATPGRSGPSA